MSLSGNRNVFKWFSEYARSNAGFRQRFWKWWYNFLASKYRDVDEWTCMNYGYLSQPYSGNPPLEHTSKMLYENVVQGLELDNAQVLEIGCGRGGGLHHLHLKRRIKSSIGVDLSEWNVAFCNQRFDEINLTYQVGSAMEIPGQSEYFDAVINVESSHIYPDVQLFCSEVFRVLKSGGTFCFTDFREANALKGLEDCIQKSGLEIVKKVDISKNVSMALSADADNRHALIGRYVPFWLRSPVSQFAGVPGSKFFNDLNSGQTIYISIQARKP